MYAWWARVRGGSRGLPWRRAVNVELVHLIFVSDNEMSYDMLLDTGHLVETLEST